MIVIGMNELEKLEEIVKLGKDISKTKGKETFIYYLTEMRYKGFDKAKFQLLMAKYGLLKKEYIENLDLLQKREIIDLLITSILHPS